MVVDKGHRVLVCGGRDFNDWALMDRALSELDSHIRIEHLIHGDATGADKMAGKWAQGFNIAVHVFPADWKKHGRSAGPIRNEQMLREGHPDYVVAFPGGRGTAHMVRIAREARIPVIQPK